MPSLKKPQKNKTIGGAPQSIACTALQSPCNQPLQSCLANSLYDYFNADLARIAAGTTPLYMVSRWGGGNPNAQQVCPGNAASLSRHR